MTEQMAAVRAVFQAMFDAVCVAPDFTEDRWIDFIRAFDTMGRLLFGYPHLESSESDIFGALDDIAFQLTATKDAIEKTTKEARIVMHDIHAALGADEDEGLEKPQPSAPAQPVPVEHDSVEEPAAVASPVEPAPSPVDRAPNEAVAEPPRVIEPQRPNEQDERLFAVIRADPTISIAVAERAVGMAQSRGIQRMKLLDGYGTLPADIKEWRENRAKTRGVPKGVNSQAIREEINARTPAPQTIADALAAPSFDERRKESAREASERTWRERHPEEARA